MKGYANDGARNQLNWNAFQADRRTSPGKYKEISYHRTIQLQREEQYVHLLTFNGSPDNSSFCVMSGVLLWIFPPEALIFRSARCCWNTFPKALWPLFGTFCSRYKREHTPLVRCLFCCSADFAYVNRELVLIIFCRCRGSRRERGEGQIHIIFISPYLHWVFCWVDEGLKESRRVDGFWIGFVVRTSLLEKYPEIEGIALVEIELNKWHD